MITRSGHDITETRSSVLLETAVQLVMKIGRALRNVVH